MASELVACRDRCHLAQAFTRMEVDYGLELKRCLPMVKSRRRYTPTLTIIILRERAFFRPSPDWLLIKTIRLEATLGAESGVYVRWQRALSEKPLPEGRTCLPKILIRCFFFRRRAGRTLRGSDACGAVSFTRAGS